MRGLQRGKGRHDWRRVHAFPANRRDSAQLHFMDGGENPQANRATFSARNGIAGGLLGGEMTTLYNRATASQRRILRAVEGAVKNVAHHHPEYQLTPRLARSIAKRAAGTLTAQWPDVLAARSALPDRAGVSSIGRTQPSSSYLSTAMKRGPSQPRARRSPLRLLWKELSAKVGEAKKRGQPERAQAFIEILQRIAVFEREGRS